MTKNHLIGLLLLAFVALLCFHSCEGEKLHDVKHIVATDLRKGQADAATIDSAVTATEKATQAAYQDSLQVARKAQDSAEAAADYWERIAAKRKAAYRQTPTLAGCDSVLTATENQVTALNSALQECTTGQRYQDSVITSQSREIEGKNAAITTLNSNLSKAIAELEKPQPKAKGQLFTVVGGVGATYLPSGSVVSGLQVTGGINIVGVVNRLKK